MFYLLTTYLLNMGFINGLTVVVIINDNNHWYYYYYSKNVQILEAIHLSNSALSV